MKRIWILGLAAVLLVGGYAGYRRWMAPTRILVVNALDSQQADIVLSNDSRHIRVDCVDADEMSNLDSYDAVVIYARRIFLSDSHVEDVKRAAAQGIPAFT